MLDARNHGDSPHVHSNTYEEQVEDVKKFYSDININKAIVIGHSMGGRTAMALALSNVYFFFNQPFLAIFFNFLFLEDSQV